YLKKIDEFGGAIKAIEQKFFQTEISNSAYEYQNEIESNEKIVVGVNEYVENSIKEQRILKVDPSIRKIQSERLRKLKKRRNNEKVKSTLAKLEHAASGLTNLLPILLECVEAYGTVGEISDALRKIFGTYKES
ncbi:MAG: methylmalonyl-CoA mutase family protein, partial [bacterium]